MQSAKTRWIIHPLLIGMLAVLLLYGNNSGEVMPGDLLRPLLLSTALGGVVWLCLALLYRSVRKSALGATAFLLYFWYASYAVDLVLHWFTPVEQHLRLWYAAMGLPVLGVLIFLFFSRRRFVLLNQWIQFVCMVLMLTSCVPLILQAAKDRAKTEPKEAGGQMSGIDFAGEKPDVYYLLLDAFASFSTCKDLLNYNNDAFRDFLEDRDFFIADESEQPDEEPCSPLKMAAILNMSTQLCKGMDVKDSYALIRSNRVVSLFRDLGYSTYYIPLYSYEADAVPMYGATETFTWRASSRFNLTTFEKVLYASSLPGGFFPLDDRLLIGIPDYKSGRADVERIKRQYAYLKRVIRKPGPKFVYAHLEWSHFPFVFNERGEFIGRHWESSDYYLGQFIYTVNLVKTLVNQILAESPSAVIILQSDHGPRKRTLNATRDFAQTPRHTRNIFNALRINGKATEILQANIPPEDTFRVVFRALFDIRSAE